METDKWRRMFWKKSVGITHPRPDATVGTPPPFEGRVLGGGFIFNIFNTIALYIAKPEVSILVRGKPSFYLGKRYISWH